MVGLLVVWAAALLVVHYPTFHPSEQVKMGKMRPLKIADQDFVGGDVEEGMCQTPGAQPQAEAGECSKGVELRVEAVPTADVELMNIGGVKTIS